MANLRKKVEDEPSMPKHVLTEAGVGYRFRP
jgi:two-component system KDP operon response regulator KdpE